MFKLKEVIISITNRCNSKCKMCDIPSTGTEELNTSIWKQVIKDASLIGAQTIVFSGGEPLLRDDIFELISFVKNNHMNACLASNGLMIDEEISYKLFRSGIDVVNISIEGSKEIHDYLRGRDNFEKAVFALENLRRYKIESTIATFVSRYNYKYLSYIVELAKQYGVTTIKFQPFSNIFLNNNYKGDDFLISDVEVKELNQMIKEVVLLCRNYGIVTNPDSYIEKMPLYLSKRSLVISTICSGLCKTCPINSKGEIYPCWILTDKDKLMGDIKEERFLNIWSSQIHRSIIEEIKKEGCPGCMMSCYDENFGRENIEERIVISIKRLQRKGFYEYIVHLLKKWQKRFKFYTAYRGSLKEIIIRFKKLFRKKRLYKLQIEKDKIEETLKEIYKAEQRLKEAMSLSWK